MCSFLDDLHTGSDAPTSPGSLKGKGAFSFLLSASLGLPLASLPILLSIDFMSNHSPGSPGSRQYEMLGDGSFLCVDSFEERFVRFMNTLKSFVRRD